MNRNAPYENDDNENDGEYEKEEWDDGRIMLGATGSNESEEEEDGLNFYSPQTSPRTADVNTKNNDGAVPPVMNTSSSFSSSPSSSRTATPTNQSSSFVLEDLDTSNQDVDALLLASSPPTAPSNINDDNVRPTLQDEQIILSILRSAGLSDAELMKRITLVKSEDTNSNEEEKEGILTHQRIQQVDLNSMLNLESIPRSIGNLQELTKLSCQSCDYIETLPAELSKLQKLQELNLLFCSSLQELPFRSKNQIPPKLNKLFLGTCIDTTAPSDDLSKALLSFQSLVNDTCHIMLQQDPNAYSAAAVSSNRTKKIDTVDGLEVLQTPPYMMENHNGESYKWPFPQSRHNHWSERNGRWCYAERDNDEGTDAAEQRYREAEDRTKESQKCCSFFGKLCFMCFGCGSRCLGASNNAKTKISPCTFCDATSSIHVDYMNAKRYMSIHQIAKAVELYKVIVTPDRVPTNASDSMLQAFACIDLGILYLTHTPLKNENEAALLLKRAALVYGVPVAMYLYGKVLLLGIGGATPNIPLAIEYLNEAGTEGIGEAYFELGMAYEVGHIVPYDLTRATDFYVAAGRTYKPNRSRKGWWKPHWDIMSKFHFTPTLSTPLEQVLSLNGSSPTNPTGGGGSTTILSWLIMLAAQAFLLMAASILSTNYQPEHYAMLLMGIPCLGILVTWWSMVMSLEHMVRTKRYRAPVLELLQAKRYAYQNLLWEAQVRYAGGNTTTNEDQNSIYYSKVVGEEWSFRTRGVMNSLLRSMTKFVESYMMMAIHLALLGVWGMSVVQEILSHRDGCSDWLENRCQDPLM